MAALTGRMTPGQRTLLRHQLAHVAFLDEAIPRLDGQSAGLMRPYQDAAARLCTVTGIARRTAEVIGAELGVDMGPFPSAHHGAAWAGLCPANHESAGKVRAVRTRKGSRWLRAALIEPAGATRRTKTYLAAQSHRLARRRGKQKATVAVAHSLLVIAYHILKDGTTYRDLGHDSFDKLRSARLQDQLIARLEALGLRVTVDPMPQVA